MQVEPGTEFEVWAADGLCNILRTDEPPREAPSTVILAGARDEYESGQVVVRGGGAMKGLRAQLTALIGPGGAQIPASAGRCRFVGYVPTDANSPSTPEDELVAKAPVDLPDPLLEDEQLDVPADTTQPIWLTVHIPADAAPGEYKGQARLTWDGGRAEVPVELTVWPFTLPRERHLLFTNWFSAGALARHYGVEAYSDDFWPIFEKYVANCAEHRQNILWVSPSTIKSFVDDAGVWSFDFSVFDRWVQILEKHGVADLIEISPLGHHKSGWGGSEIALSDLKVFDKETGEARTVKAEEGLKHYLPALQDHLRERGWLHKSVIHIADEPAVQNVASWQEKADWVHSLAPEIRRIDAIEGPDFGDSLEIWVPKLNHYYNWQAAYERARDKGAEIWFYTCCHPFRRYPNRYVDYPLIKTRILHWLNWRYNLTGYLHWGLLQWTDDPYASPIRGNLPPGDSWIVYPGDDGPVDSIRWESVRDGIEDYEYLWLLTDAASRVKERLGPAAAGFDPRQLADDLCFEAAADVLEYVRDSEVLADIRLRAAQQIVALSKEPPLLVWTDPPARHALAGPPAVAVVYIATQPGASVTLNDKAVELDERGCHAQNLFLKAGEHTVNVTATLGDETNNAVCRLRVVE